MIKLLAYASLKHKEINVDFASEALRDKLQNNTGLTTDASTLSIGTIQSLVAQEWDVTPEGLKSKTRTKSLTIPRQIAMYLVRELLGTQLVEIGAAFGGRDHSTVIHSLDRVITELKTNMELQKRVDKVRTQLRDL